MIFTVYHAKEPTFGFGEVPVYPEGYKAIAVIDSPDLKETFRITNHIEENWEKNPEVLEILIPNNRSTSVGDVMVGNDGKVFRCEMVGWKEINE